MRTKYPRADHDFYASPAWAGDALVETVSDLGRIWEPACGDGALSHAFGGLATDLVNRGQACDMEIDFFDVDRLPPGIDTIATNPPYGRVAGRFLDHALRLAPRRVALLMPWNWFGEASRLRYWQHMEHVILLGRVSMMPAWGEDKGYQARRAFAWFVLTPGANKNPFFSQWTP